MMADLSLKEQAIVREVKERERFEDAALAYFKERVAAGLAVDDNGCEHTKEALFWKTESGNYGVRHFNSAWWGWKTAALWQPLVYQYEGSRIVLPDDAPFDGKAVLVRTRTGVVEAWWDGWHPRPTLEDPNDGDGWQWVAYDSALMLDLDDVLEWRPLP